MVFKDEHSIRPPRGAGGGSNAALAYFEAWDMPTRKEFVRLNELAANVPEPDKKIQPELRAALSEHSGYVDSLLKAASIEHCDWGFGWSAGWGMLLPHLGWTRMSCRVLAADARRCMEDGSAIAAIERVRAMVRLGQHASEGPVLISSLVGIAIMQRGVTLTNELLDHHAFTPAQARMLLRVFEGIPREDLCHTRASIRKEREITVAWLLEKCRSAEPGLDYSRLMREMGMGASEWFVAGMTREQFERDLARAERYYHEIDRAWAGELPQVRLSELEEQLMELQHGLIACQMTPSVGRAQKTVANLEKTLNKLERRLKKIAEPEQSEGVQESQGTKAEGPQAKTE
ncbi:MAG TPA: hypothetical protein VD997_16970 [Phycisphaerales bacterium]|nr:hypothetical protein [Phycisphaerales bacterium]